MAIYHLDNYRCRAVVNTDYIIALQELNPVGCFGIRASLPNESVDLWYDTYEDRGEAYSFLAKQITH